MLLCSAVYVFMHWFAFRQTLSTTCFNLKYLWKSVEPNRLFGQRDFSSILVFPTRNMSQTVSCLCLTIPPVPTSWGMSLNPTCDLHEWNLQARIWADCKAGIWWREQLDFYGIWLGFVCVLFSYIWVNSDKCRVLHCSLLLASFFNTPCTQKKKKKLMLVVFAFHTALGEQKAEALKHPLIFGYEILRAFEPPLQITILLQ